MSGMGLAPVPAWNTNSPGGKGGFGGVVGGVPLQVNTEMYGLLDASENSPGATVSLSPGSSPESWSSLKGAANDNPEYLVVTLTPSLALSLTLSLTLTLTGSLVPSLNHPVF